MSRRANPRMKVYYLLTLVYSASIFASLEHGAQSSPLSHCVERIGPESLTHTPAKVMHNKDLTSSVYYAGNENSSCLLDSRGLRIELSRMVRVSDIGVRSNEKILVRLVRDLQSNETIKHDCRLVSVDNNFMYYRCHNTKGEYDQQGIIASAVELAVTNGTAQINLSMDETLISIIRKSYDDHPNFGRRGCLAPGHYFPRVPVGSTVFPFSHIVSDDCPHGTYHSGSKQRTCTEKGWSGRPVVCLHKNGGFSYAYDFHSPGEFFSRNVASYRTNYTFFDIEAVNAYFECLAPPCRNERLKNTPRPEIILEHVIPNITVQWTTTWDNANKPSQAVFSLRPPSKLQSCQNCTVKVKCDDHTWHQRWKLTKISIFGWTRAEYERYMWALDGCPPIDPYIGMPDKFAGEAARSPDVLNENLRRNPCREGYWHDTTEQYEKNPRQCLRNAWTGEIPVCILITCRPPPRIDYGTWHYRADLFHEVVYICDHSHVLSRGDGRARCNYATNEWEEVPRCIDAPPRGKANHTEMKAMEGCPPIDPYFGMPHDYGSPSSIDNIDVLNRNLRESPCREGYRHIRTVQYERNPKQCITNSWTGEIPKCILIPCQTPPRINNGSWRYPDIDGLFHEIAYSCDEPLVLSNEHGIAKCNLTSNEWEQVPSCIELSSILAHNTALTEHLIIILAPIAVAFFVVIVVIVCRMFSSRRKDNSHYVEAITRAQEPLCDPNWKKSTDRITSLRPSSLSAPTSIYGYIHNEDRTPLGEDKRSYHVYESI